LTNRRSNSRLYSPVVILVSVLLASAVTAQQTPPAAMELYEQALEAESLQQTITLLERALAIAPRYDLALYHLGRAYYQTRDYLNAIDRFTRIVDTTAVPTSGLTSYLRNAHTFYAQDLLEQGQPGQALQHVREALAFDADYAPALTVLGITHAELQNREQAIATLKKSLRLDAEQTAAWNRLGDLYLTAESYRKAIGAYERSLAIDAEQTHIRHQLAMAQQANAPEAWLNKYAQTVQTYGAEAGMLLLERAVANNPESQEIAAALQDAIQERDYLAGMHAMEQGEWQLAFNTLQKVNPNYKDTALKLEEARSELLLAQAQTLNDSATVTVPREVPDETTTHQLAADTTDTPDSVTQILTMTYDSLQQTQKEQLSDSHMVQQTSIDSTRLDSIVVANEFPEVTLSEETTEPLSRLARIRATLTWPIVAGATLLGLMVLSLIVMAVKKRPIPVPSRESLAETLKVDGHSGHTQASLTHGTDELFQEQVASQTPVKFSPPSRKRRYPRSKKNQPAQPDVSELKALSMLETKTMLGGLPQALKIGRYLIEKEIGRGSMGQVFKAWDPKLDRTVVIKQVAFDLSANKEELAHMRDRLHREAKAVASLNHPNIVIVYDVAEEKAFSYIVMEYVEGHDLHAVLQKSKKLELPHCLTILQQICLALDFAHKHHVIHRDIKPSNILLTHSHEAKVADFGIAKLPQLGTLTHTGNVMGTPFYMSPEQIEGKHLDGRTDIFSVGVMMYEMLTGVRPFIGETIPAVVYKIVHKDPIAPSLLNDTLPEEVNEVVERALAKDPENRYTDAAQFLLHLRKLEKNLA